MSDIKKYRNGDYDVYIDAESGCKVRNNNRDDDVFTPDFPECCDLCITTFCDKMCPFCYVSSDSCGKHAKLADFEGLLSTFHPWTEVALGGGSPILHPEIDEYLEFFKKHDIIASMTMHSDHFVEYRDRIEKWIENRMLYGVGVSLQHFSRKTVDSILKFRFSDHCVVHTIAGISLPEDIDKFIENRLKVLVLGYKNMGRGLTSGPGLPDGIQSNINELKTLIGNLVNAYGVMDYLLSFDNLAIAQLGLRGELSEEAWNRLYMGDDGLEDKYNSATMYADLVNRKFARNSISSSSYDFDGFESVDDMFRKLVDHP